MKYLNRFTPVLLILVLIMFSISCGQDKKENKADDSGEMVGQAPVENNEAQISQEKEYIDLSVDVSELAGLQQGDTVELINTRRNTTHNLKIRKVQETMPGYISISANIEDRDTGLATLVLRDNKLTGTLQLYKEDLRYHVAYDDSTSRHFLTEVKPEDIDEIEGGKPLEPGE